MIESEPDTAIHEARQRARYTSDLLWHTGAFLIINAYLWLLDAMWSEGIVWAFWITAAWGFALAFHTLAWFIDGRDFEDRLARRYLQTRRRSTGPARKKSRKHSTTI